MPGLHRGSEGPHRTDPSPIPLLQGGGGGERYGPAQLILTPMRTSQAVASGSATPCYVDTCSNTARACRIPNPQISSAGSNDPGSTIHNTQPR